MRRFSITVAVTIMVIASISTPALADQPEGAVHIALGDSVAAGSGANNGDVTGYVARLNRWLRSVDSEEGGPSASPHLELSDYSVGGATSSDLLADQLPAAFAESTARGTDIKYVTLTIGGNDVFEPVIGACGEGITPTCESTIQSVFETYQTNLATILGTLRVAAPQAKIAIMTYYNPIGSCDRAPLAPLADIVLEGGGPLPGGLNDIIRGVAGAVGGVTVVETGALLDSDDFVGGEDCLHPDDSGHRQIARAFLRALS